MTKQIVLIATGVFLSIAPLPAQSVADLDRVKKMDQGYASRVVTGRPFSAIEEHHSLQILGDGTKIENTQTNLLYRDSEGRTRVENRGGAITLVDPVAGFKAELNPVAKIVAKVNLIPSPIGQEALLDKFQALSSFDPSPSAVAGITAGLETLGPQVINNMLAKGTRITTRIPVGQIGNDREIEVVTERWYSDDLQILIKSTNSDPRFGDTAYQVTNIVQGPPDAALFQIPADYRAKGAALPASDLDEARKAKMRAADEAKRRAMEQHLKGTLEPH